MSTVTRAAGVAGTFNYTLDTVPVEPPLYTLFSDAALSVVAQPERASVATASASTWTCSYDSTLPQGTYYLQFRNRFVVGQPYVIDADDQLILADPEGTLTGSTPPVTRLREMTDAGTEFDDSQLQATIDSNTDPVTGVIDYDAAARHIWSIKAARYAALVDVSESGSSRKLSDLHKNALAMVKQYTPSSEGGSGADAAPAPLRAAKTRAIERA